MQSQRERALRLFKMYLFAKPNKKNEIHASATKYQLYCLIKKKCWNCVPLLNTQTNKELIIYLLFLVGTVLDLKCKLTTSMIS